MSEFLVVSSTFARQPWFAILLAFGIIVALGGLFLRLRARPDPKWVVAIGGCARDSGLFAGSYAVVGGVSDIIPVDLHIDGCPPSPIALLSGLLAWPQHQRRGLIERADMALLCLAA